MTSVQPSFSQILDVSEKKEELHRLRKRVFLLRLLGILLLAAAISVTCYPFARQWVSAQQLKKQDESIQQQVAGWPYSHVEESLRAAHAYNRQLAKTDQSMIGEVKDPFASKEGASQASDEDTASAKDRHYQHLLDVRHGVMGAIRIPEISVDLPIYHGTSAAVLRKGAGHLYGTSLPVGGPSTHAVITGHRGMTDALMFTRIDELRPGDPFYVDVLGKTLGYRVDRIRVIEPNDASQLRIIPGEDRVTLMTCTPYGVNTQRLLVSGLRANIPRQVPYPGFLHDARVISLCVGIGLLLGGIVVLALIRHVHSATHAYGIVAAHLSQNP